MDDSDVNDILGPTIVRLVRGSTVAVAATGLLVFVADVTAGLLGGRSQPPLQVVALAVVAIALLTRRIPVRRALRTGDGWPIIAFYPLLVGCMLVALTPLFPQMSVLPFVLLLTVHVAGMVSGRNVAMATLVLHAAATLWAHALADVPDLPWTVAVIAVGAGVWWASRSSIAAVLRAYERQADTMEHVERVAQARQDFVATVSHELRTPIHLVSGLADTLDARWAVLDDQQRHDLVGRLRRNGDRLRGLVDGLLDFTRLRADTVELRPAVFDVDEVATDVVRVHASSHPAHVLRLDSSGRHQVVADPLLVERVVDNLVRNACDHTPAGTTITVRTSHDGHDLEVAVVDDGPGIAASDLPRLTERFFRGGDHLSRDGGGVGIGLAFCADVLQLHGRRLEVESAPGHGASFSFTLPVATAPSRSLVDAE